MQLLIDCYRHNVTIVSSHPNLSIIVLFLVFIEYRQWSNRIPLAYKLSIASSVIWFLITGHRLVLYSTADGSCSSLAGFYADFDNYLEVVVIGMFPPILMSVLAYLLIKSVRSVIHRQVAPDSHLAHTTVVHRTVLQQIDAQLTLMLILQSIITIITYVPYAAQLIYSNVTAYWPKSALRLAQEKVFIELIHLMSYVFFATAFYVSMISSSGFRRQMKSYFKRQQEVAPSGITPSAPRTVPTINTHPK